jgi:hypothetical protein
MVFREDEWSRVSRSVRNLPPETGYPTVQRVKVRFEDGPPETAACLRRAAAAEEEPKGLYVIRLGRKPGTVLRTLHQQGEL